MTSGGQVDDFWREWSDLGLKRLFNPGNTEFLPIEDQIKKYKERDLRKTKFYMTACKIFGGMKASRRRVIVAPSMEKVEKPKRGGVEETNPALTDTPSSKRRLEPIELAQPQGKSKPSNRGQEDRHGIGEVLRGNELIADSMTAAEIEEYKDWVGERVTLEKNLKRMELSEEWFLSKPELTSLEQRVYQQMLKDKQKNLLMSTQQSSRESDSRLKAISDARVTEQLESPAIVDPPAEALAIIDKYLTQHHLRLLDLFRWADKDKDWMLTKEEFKNCIKSAKIPISDGLLEDLMNALDTDLNEQLDYTEFAAGMKKFKLHQREIKTGSSRVKGKLLFEEREPSRLRSAGSAISTGTTNSSTSFYLGIPSTDLTENVSLTPDQMIEKRKKEKFFNAERQTGSSRGRRRGGESEVHRVRTGNRAIDSHCRPSTLTPDPATAEEVDRFRELRLKEFYRVKELCQKQGVRLSQRLLERVLLHPGDKSHRRCRRRLRQVGMSPSDLFSSHFADPPPKPKPPPEVRHAGKVHRSKSGQLWMQQKHTYPHSRHVDPLTNRDVVNLSTGKAFVGRKVDCWLTFEDYDRLTRHLRTRFVEYNAEPEEESSWPSYMLDKINLFITDKRHDPSHALFRETVGSSRPPNLGYDNNLLSWPISSQSYLKYGDHTQQKKYTIEKKL